MRRAAEILDQPELPLGLPAGADASLREAYDACDLARHSIPFERAVQTPSTRLCLTRVAQHRATTRRNA